MSAKPWNNVSYLDALRPEPCWHVDRAVLTTYSADLVPVGAALLALSGAEDDGTTGSRVEFANAVEKLRGRVRVLAQAGRLVPPRRRLPIFAVFDQFVREMSFDERAHSWHPKTALLRLREDSGDAVQWRFWVGSRNLTRDLSWDSGLLLVADATGRKGTAPVPGIAELAQEWFERAQFTARTTTDATAELARARWWAPDGITVEEVLLLSRGATRRLPKAPIGVRKLTVVSPFLDVSTLKTLGAWPAKSKTLLSSDAELVRIAGRKPDGRASLAAFGELLAFGAPTADDAAVPASSRSENSALEAGNADSAVEERGLHAKLILAEHAAGHTLWLGSANATTRGWNGRNTEVVARLQVKPAVAEGIAALAALAGTVNLGELPAPSPDSAEEDVLEDARKRLAVQWPLTQQRLAAGTTIVAEQPPDLPTGVELEAAPISLEPAPWPAGAVRLEFALPPGEMSELIQLRLRLGAFVCAWLQRAPLYPAPTADRDHQAIANFLDVRTFFAWLRALLGYEAGEGGGPWDEEADDTPATPSRTGNAPAAVWALTLEEILKAWHPGAPARLHAVDGQVKNYLAFIRQRADIATPAERKALADFQRVWQVVAGELLS